MTAIVRTERLGKSYTLQTRESLPTFRDALSGAARSAGRLLRGRRPQPDEILWALRDVNLEVHPGEVLGVIGRNGAGKSTLLKLISRIIMPSAGRIELYGRVASLLEVGTGFHWELSGRENIFLNGAILGMSRHDIRRKFDDIVAFAEVERFIDMPVKRYSSGMYLRLAFAVAAQLEPDVLVVDEILAVGDVAFQRKCLQKMQAVREQGRTVVFVSHNMPAVSRLCPRTVILDAGRVIHDGSTDQAVRTYLASGLGLSGERQWPEIAHAPGTDVARLRRVRVHLENGEVCNAIDIRNPVGVEMQFDVLTPGHVLIPSLHFFNEEHVCVFTALEQDTTWRVQSRPVGRHVATAWIPGNLLSEGTLVVAAALDSAATSIEHFFERDAVAFQIVDSMDGDSARGSFGGPLHGVVRPKLVWTSSFVPD